MRWDIRINSHFFMAAGFLAVCVMAAPDYLHFTPVASALCFWGGLIGALCFAIAGFRTAFLGEAFKPTVGHIRRMVGLYGMVVCAVGFVGFAATYLWTNHKEVKANTVSGATAVSSKELRQPLTLEQVFESDFPELLKAERKESVSVKGPSSLDTTFDLRFQLLEDFRSNTCFVSIFLPVFHDARLLDAMPSIIENLRDTVQPTVEEIKRSVIVGTKEPGGSYSESGDLRFSQKVFLYTMNQLDPVQIGNIVKFYRDRALSLEIRGSDYYFYNVRGRPTESLADPAPPPLQVGK